MTERKDDDEARDDDEAAERADDGDGDEASKPAAQKAEKLEDADKPAAERADFAKHYPEDAALQKLLAAFDRGDYFAVRRDAEGVAKATKDPAVARAARDLRQRIEPAKTASLLLLVGLALAVFVGGYFLLQHEHRDAPGTPTPQAPSARP